MILDVDRLPEEIRQEVKPRSNPCALRLKRVFHFGAFVGSTEHALDEARHVCIFRYHTCLGSRVEQRSGRGVVANSTCQEERGELDVIHQV